MLLKSGIHFDKWANKRVLEQLKDYSIPEAISLLSHIIHAQTVWISRIEGRSFSGDIFEQLSYSELEKRLNLNHEMLLSVIETISEETIVEYKSLKGEPQESTFSDIVFHVIIHGQHHRAQIATHIRQAGFTPLATDYIVYTRIVTHN